MTLRFAASSGGTSSGLVAGVVVGVVCLIVLVAVVLVIIRRRRSQLKVDPRIVQRAQSVSVQSYDADEQDFKEVGAALSGSEMEGRLRKESFYGFMADNPAYAAPGANSYDQLSRHSAGYQSVQARAPYDVLVPDSTRPEVAPAQVDKSLINAATYGTAASETFGFTEPATRNQRYSSVNKAKSEYSDLLAHQPEQQHAPQVLYKDVLTVGVLRSPSLGLGPNPAYNDRVQDTAPEYMTVQLVPGKESRIPQGYELLPNYIEISGHIYREVPQAANAGHEHPSYIEVALLDSHHPLGADYLVPSSSSKPPPSYEQVVINSNVPAWFRNARTSVLQTMRLAALASIKLTRATAEALLDASQPPGTYFVRRNTKRQHALVLTLRRDASTVKHMEVCPRVIPMRVGVTHACRLITTSLAAL